MSYVNLLEATEYPALHYHPWEGTDGLGHVANFVWDIDTLAWIKQTAVNGNNPATEVEVTNFPAGFDANIQVGDVDVGAGNPVPISAASLPLPSGAATESTLSTLSGKFTSGTSTLSNVSASASSVSLLASNSSRKGAVFHNDSTATCYVKFGTTASTSSFTVKLAGGDTLILENNPIYTGAIDGIWDSATGAMRITELT